ncbi:MAG: DUF1512 domain-containing protein [Desulfurococcaceae archaeon]
MNSSDWSSLFFQIFWIIFFIMILTGANQRIQMKLWSLDVRNKLRVMRRYIDEDNKRVENYLRNLGVENPQFLIRRLANYFIIEPVSIEPTDIIKRLDHLIRNEETSVRKIVSQYLPNIGEYERSLVETSLVILGVLEQVYKIVQHYLIVSEKENNWILLMQLVLVMPQILKYVEIYHNALDPFLTGKPIGDTIGPYIAFKFIENSDVVSQKVIEDTCVLETRFENRRLFIIKAKGPGSNVGKPGKVLADLIENLKGNVDLVITVDAALKLESERVGEIAEGIGAAIGDPGPEKIAIERATSKYNIPLKAIVVKIGLEDAITTMKKEVYEACERAYEYIRRVILETTPPNSTVILAGIGNTIGVS